MLPLSDIKCRCQDNSLANTVSSPLQPPKMTIPLIRQLLSHPRSKTAVASSATSNSLSYNALLNQTAILSDALAPLVPPSARIAYLLPPSDSYITTQLATLLTSAVAVPLSPLHTPTELGYFLEDAAPKLVVTQTAEYRDKIQHALEEVNLTSKVKLIDYDEIVLEGPGGTLPPPPSTYDNTLLTTHAVDMSSPALFIYTSGTTGPPKGVVHTHTSFTAQLTDLCTAWKWVSSDHILHFLPLHHVHGIQNKLNCALYAGASVEFVKFNPLKVWERLADGEMIQPTVFMGVPTVYAKLLETARSGCVDDAVLANAVANLRSMRLHVSGSAALPQTVMNAWEQLTGHVLLERYGMSELGMALGNPYDGVRQEGFVGRPFDSVQVRHAGARAEADTQVEAGTRVEAAPPPSLTPSTGQTVELRGQRHGELPRRRWGAARERRNCVQGVRCAYANEASVSQRRAKRSSEACVDHRVCVWQLTLTLFRSQVPQQTRRDGEGVPRRLVLHGRHC